MRRLTRERSRPAPLHRSRLVAQLKEIHQYFQLDPADRRRRRPRVDSDVFNSGEVFETILGAQRRRCAYCEQHVDAFNASVTHYRPTSNAILSERELPDIQYYAWFAYEWDNLLIACHECDQAKAQNFPLIGSAVRPGASWAEAVARERPLLIDPYRANVSLHLMFDHSGEAVGRSDEGVVTIDVMDLNRSTLVRARAEELHALRILLGQSTPADVEESLLGFLQTARFPGVVEIFLQNFCRVSELDIQGSENLSGSRLLGSVAKVLSRLHGQDVNLLIDRLHPKDIAFVITNTKLAGFKVARHPRNAYLSSLKVASFKGLSKIAINLKAGKEQAPCLMLLGENAVGKSSVLQAIKIALSTPGERARLSPSLKQISGNSEFELNLQNGEAVKVRSAHGGRFHSDRTADCVVIGYGARRYFSPGFSRRKSAPPSKTLFDPLAILRDPKRWLEDADDYKFDAVARALRSILCLEDEESIVKDEHRTIFIKVGESLVRLDHLSDGYKSLFAMSVDIMRELLETWENLELAEAIVLIDEVENHLHPRWKMRVMAALRDAMPRVQFICTTHDPLCLRGMKDGEVVLLRKRPSGGTEVHQDLPDISTLRIEQILASDYFGLSSTVDPVQDQILRRLAELAGKSEDSLTEQQRDERDTLLSKYQGIPYIGSSTDRQVLSEAITRHLRMNPKADLKDVSAARESSINAIMAVLKRAMQA